MLDLLAIDKYMICKVCNGHGYIKRKAVNVYGEDSGYYVDASCPENCNIRESSSGRTKGFEPLKRGSNPCSRTKTPRESDG